MHSVFFCNYNIPSQVTTAEIIELSLHFSMVLSNRQILKISPFTFWVQKIFSVHMYINLFSFDHNEGCSPIKFVWVCNKVEARTYYGCYEVHAYRIAILFSWPKATLKPRSNPNYPIHEYCTNKKYDSYICRTILHWIIG